jgi:periplasmic copper chaperone A
MTTHLLAPIAALAAISCSPTPPQAVTVSDAIVSLPAVPGRPGAAYFTIDGDAENIVLTGVSSPQAGRIELHETMQQGGMHRMAPIRSLPIGRAQVRFAPGGRHAMLFDIQPAVAVGGTMPLTFRFEGAPEVTVQAEIRAPGDVAH